MGERPEAGPRPKNSFLSALGWIVTSVGVPSLLIAMGFVIDSAQEDFLGVSLHGFDPKADARIGGTFLIDSISLVSDLLSRHPLSAVFLPVVLLAFAILILRLRLPRVISVISQDWLAVVIGVVLLVLVTLNFRYFELPLFPIKQVLFYKPTLDLPFYAPATVQERTAELWKLMVCSRDTIAGCPPKKTDLRAKLADEYLKNLLSTLAVTVIVAAFVGFWMRPRFSHGRAREMLLSGFLTGTLITSAIINCFGLLYTYGKTMRSTEFESGTVQLPASISTPAIPDPAESRQSPKNGNAKGGNTSLPASLPVQAIIVSDDNAELTFYAESSEGIWRISKSNDLVIRTHGVYDIFTCHIVKSLNPSRGCGQ